MAKPYPKRSMAEILADHPLFKGLNKEITDVLSGCAVNRQFPDKSYLFKADDAADTFFLLRAGQVALELNSPGRGRLIVQTVPAGQMVGASWILPPYCWRFDARALGPVRVTAIDAACLRQKCDANPAMGYAVLQRFLPIVAERLQATRLRLLDLYGPPSQMGPSE